MTTVSIAEREPEQLQLNGVIEVSPEEAVELWADGQRMPCRDWGGHGSLNPNRIRRPSDGQWVIKRGRHKGLFPSHDHTAEWAMGQLEHLQNLGLDIISRGMVPSPDGETILTVTPWLSDIVQCDNNIFNEKIAPILNRYFAGATVGNLILGDLRRPHQYSQRLTTDKTLLHDIEPYMWKANDRNRSPILPV